MSSCNFAKDLFQSVELQQNKYLNNVALTGLPIY
jgi:hypothetical protein